MTLEQRTHDMHSDATYSNHLKAAKYAESGDKKHADYHAAIAQGHTLQANEYSNIACKKVADAVSPAK